MIFDSLKNFEKYLPMNKNFAAVLEFMQTTDLDEMPLGKHEINDEVFVISEKVDAKQKSEAVLEAHKLYIDVQLCRNSVDNMGWTDLADCESVKEELSDRDLYFYNGDIQKQVAVGKENFVVFFPWDAHAPNIGEGELHKIIFKVRV